MKTLQEIKHDFALEFGLKNWNELTEMSSKPMLQNHMNDIARRYARACCEASLKKADENALIYEDEHGVWQIAKESITSPENIVLL